MNLNTPNTTLLELINGRNFLVNHNMVYVNERMGSSSLTGDAIIEFNLYCDGSKYRVFKKSIVCWYEYNPEGA